MSASAYRSLEPALQERLEALRERHAAGCLAASAAQLVAVRRIAWAAAGGAGTLMGIAAFVCVPISFNLDHLQSTSTVAGGAYVLAGAWPAALLAHLGGRWAAQVSTSRALAAPRRPSGNLAAELARLEAADPLRSMTALATRWEWPGAALPLAALSLVAPLSLHWLVISLFALVHRDVLPTGADFGFWMGLGVVMVGHAHVALLAMAVLWARSLRACDTASLRVGIHKRWAKALGVATAVAAVPGIVLIAIPPLIVAVTGLAFVPAMYIWTARRVQRERGDLERALPAA